VTVRVLLVDDQPLLRMGFRLILDAEADLEVVGEAGDGREAIRRVRELAPDVVLMDVRMPVLDGVAATAEIVAAGGPSRVLILTTFDLDEYVFAGLRAGASGFLLKDVPPAELVSAIWSVAAGDAVVSPRATRRLLEVFGEQLALVSPGAGSDGAGGRGPSAAASVRARLTDREYDVLLLIAEGLSNREIAARLFLVEATVKTHVGRVLSKLDLGTRVQAVVLAYETGLVRPTAPTRGPGAAGRQ
jgi:DNA-binding NarL/FixJ family response regulator